MYEYKILIVDDEFHVIDMITRLLEQLEGVPLDIYAARNVTEAVNLLELGRMDLVITDIEMPGKNGLELVSYIRSRWTSCRVVILTAFSQFQYAYSALQLHVDGYILKTESDMEILEKLRAILREIDADMTQNAYYAEKKKHRSFAAHTSQLTQLLCTPLDWVRQTEQLQDMGFSSDASNLFLLMCRSTKPNEQLSNEYIVHELLSLYFRDSLQNIELARLDDSTFVWLLELTDAFDANRFSGTLEMIQNACSNAFSLSFSFVFSICSDNSAILSRTYSAMLCVFDHMVDSGQAFIYHLVDNSDLDAVSPGIPEVTLSWLCKYIDENISCDLSLINLAALTGYNPQYLSGLFRRKLNTTLSRYISEKRMSIAREMLTDIKIPIQDIAQRLGFSSHAYFSRFVRKETGMSPQQLRIQLVEKSTRTGGEK